MNKSPDAFRSIGEVSRLVGVAPHVLRYWETQFTQLMPVKRGDGRRYYRPDDVRLIAGLCQVMREEGLSIRGAKRLIAADRGASLRNTGAARLGEAATDPSPDLAEGIDVTRAATRRRKPLTKNGAVPMSATPCSANATDWLRKLVETARRLRQHEAAQRTLPPEIVALRRTIRAAR